MTEPASPSGRAWPLAFLGPALMLGLVCAPDRSMGQAPFAPEREPASQAPWPVGGAGASPGPEAGRGGDAMDCLLAQRDAQERLDAARQAVADRRWTVAVAQFRQASGAWAQVAQGCAGPAQDAARKQRARADVDAHNAEHCGFRYDRSHAWTLQLQEPSDGLSPALRQRRQQVAETLWRDAAAHCRGRALEVARAQARLQARERGSPFLPTWPEAAEAAAASVPGPSGPMALHAPRPVEAVALQPRTQEAATPGPQASAPTTPAATFHLEGGVVLTGHFDRSPDGRGYTGRGRIQWPHGDRYDGEVQAGRRQGVGEIVWASGQRYRGDWKDDRPHGRGTLQFVNGDVYEGEIHHGQAQGQGRMIHAGGDRYVGSLEGGRPHGHGVYEWANGQRFEGLWKQGQAEGRGLLRFAHGDVYEGELQDNLPHGQGRMQYVSGDLYAGQWVRGLPWGHGLYRWAHGGQHEGRWHAGQPEAPDRVAVQGGGPWAEHAEPATAQTRAPAGRAD